MIVNEEQIVLGAGIGAYLLEAQEMRKNAHERMIRLTRKADTLESVMSRLVDRAFESSVLESRMPASTVVAFAILELEYLDARFAAAIYAATEIVSMMTIHSHLAPESERITNT